MPELNSASLLMKDLGVIKAMRQGWTNKHFLSSPERAKSKEVIPNTTKRGNISRGLNLFSLGACGFSSNLK